MPEQEPTWRIISTSYVVRIRSRCASSSLPCCSKVGELVLELGLDAVDRPLHPLRAGDVVGGREDVELLVLGEHLAGDRVQRHQPLDLVAEELDPDRVLLVDREDLEGVAADPERAAGERQVVAGVLDLDEPAQHDVAVDAPRRP